MESQRHRYWAHALGRICLGVNIFLHGLVRIPSFPQFADHLQHQFQKSFLPPPAVLASAYFIVAAETLVGFLVLIGLGTRPALIAGTLVMLFLQIGSALIQDWSIAGQQLVYIAFYVGLLATVQYDYLSIDSWRRAHRPIPPM
ncbi:MAG TPA: DoxX family protein [Rhizomicrobium sp.]|jgi:thiosulfate dehydrogenase [quinone] large subunit|nr:DoxX family protein [Rhizomicrobium sp.]